MSARPVNQKARIHVVQGGAVVLGIVLLLTHPGLGGATHEYIELVGLALVLACIAGRMWSILYVGSRKNRELVTLGPYSMTRNPLYLFSTIGAVGVGLIHGSAVVALALGLMSYLVFTITAAKEAAYLKSVFGADYDAYAARTPMFFPKLSLYRDSAEVVFSPAALKRTFLDGLFFLLTFPLLEAIEHLQLGGYLPVLVRLI